MLLKKVDNFISNMRWKAYFSLQMIGRPELKKYKKHGLKTNKHTLHIKELDNFESNLIDLVRCIKYKNIDSIQQIKRDLKNIKQIKCLLGRTTNISRCCIVKSLNIMKSPPPREFRG